MPPTVEQKPTAATRRSEDQKRKLERAEATATETMTKLADLGTGLASVGNAIIAVAPPVPDDDPTVQRLADRLLQSDPGLRAAVRRRNEKLDALVAGKKQAAAELLRWQQQATTSLATVMRDLATTSRLARLRQSIDLGLDPAASAYLRETRDAARDVLAESIYWFVKSYQYQCLEDVQDSFFEFESWADLLRAQENVRLEQERKKLEQGGPTSEPTIGTGPVVTRAHDPARQGGLRADRRGGVQGRAAEARQEPSGAAAAAAAGHPGRVCRLRAATYREAERCVGAAP